MKEEEISSLRLGAASTRKKGLSEGEVKLQRGSKRELPIQAEMRRSFRRRITNCNLVLDVANLKPIGSP